MLFSSAAHAVRRGEFCFLLRLSVMKVSASPACPAEASDSAYAHIETSCSGLLLNAVRYDCCAPAVSPRRSSTTPREYGGAGDFGSALAASWNFFLAVWRSPSSQAFQPS